MAIREIDYSRLPGFAHDLIKHYIEYGIYPGKFLATFISNDLKGTMMAAQDEELKAMFDIFVFFYNEAPNACWGSKEKMDAWIKMKGGLLK